MSSDEIREKYLKFFEDRGHVRIEPSPLVLENDPTTLFTSAGMQPLVPYLKGEPHPKGKRLVDIQPSFRTVDIDEVGDNRHLTFFEMLGNWSLGDYFKKDQLEWCLEFFVEELGLPKDKLWVSVFEGTKDVSKDTESAEVWKSLGIPQEKIFYYGVDQNWWSRSGTPESMPIGEIGGPDSEVFYEFDIPHDPKFGEKCHPNCNCGRFIEIGNSVFIQYQKNKDGSLSELPQKNVDFGGGLERISAAVNNSPDIFGIDLFRKFIKASESKYNVSYHASSETERSMRIVADHLRAAAMIISSDVFPANKGTGYVLRRLIRRATFHASLLSKGAVGKGLLPLVDELKDDGYPIEVKSWLEISKIVDEEADRFAKTLESGLKILRNALVHGKDINGSFAFDLYQTNGFPLELTLEILNKEGKEFSAEGKRKFEEEFKKHKELSRTASAGMFKGGLADTSKEVTRLHTATHLIHAALRKVLGEGVSQKGSNITAERLRFDFSHPQKLTDEEIKKVEKLVNEVVEKNLPVSLEEKNLDEALKEGALAFFGERYAGKVEVYRVGDFSKEVCGGPHVTRTSEIGRVRIVKQEKLGTGVVRIYATAG